MPQFILCLVALILTTMALVQFLPHKDTVGFAVLNIFVVLAWISCISYWINSMLKRIPNQNLRELNEEAAVPLKEMDSESIEENV